MKALMLSGRIASDLSFGEYLNRNYCIIKLECYKDFNKTEIIPCVKFCNDVEFLRQYIRKGDYIAGDGYATTYTDDDGKTSVVLVLTNFRRFVHV